MPALLNVTYTPNYIGSHRICFRTTQPSYCCYLDDSASVIGVPKTTVIDLDEFETCLQDLPSQVGCGDTPLDGYIQPFCVDQGSDLNRVSFTADFPSTPCQSYSVQCQVSSVAEIQVSDPGYGWLPGDVPTVTITDLSGYGSGATAEAVMACNDSNICFVESITIIDPGESYYLINQIVVDISLPTDPGGTPAQAQVTALDDCGTFTVPNCDGTDNPTEYELWGGPQYAINVCAGNFGPVGFKYDITQNPESLPGDVCFNLSTGVLGEYTCNISPAGTHNGKNYYTMVNPDCVTPYDAFIAPNAWTVWYSTGNGFVDQWVLSEGLDQYIYVQWYLPVSSSPDVPLGNWVIGPDSGVIDLESTDTNCQISCCNCVKYEVINTALTEAREFYYTSCQDQSIVTGSVDPQDTITICAVPGSFWVQNPDDNQYVEFVVSGIQDC